MVNLHKSALVILIVLLVPACGGYFNLRGGMPGYLNYVQRSAELGRIEGLPEVYEESSVVLRSVQPEDGFARYLLNRNTDRYTELLVLSYQSGPIEPERALVFTPDLELIYDSRSLDDVFGRYDSWVYSGGNFEFRILGGGFLDLGRNALGFTEGAAEPEYRFSGRWDRNFQYATVYSDAEARYRDYVVVAGRLPASHPHVVGPEEELRLILLYSEDENGDRLPDGTGGDSNFLYDDYADFDARSVHLITSPLQVTQLEINKLGWEGFEDRFDFDFRLAEVITDRANDRIMPVIAVSTGGQQLFYLMFFLPYGDLADQGLFPFQAADSLPDDVSGDLPGGIINRYEYIVIPARQDIDSDLPVFQFDGELFAVQNWPADDNGWLSPLNARLELYRLNPGGIQPLSSENTGIDAISSFSLWDMFHSPDFLRDYSLTFAEAAGRWYVYNRAAHSIYQLGIGAGEWE